MTRFVDKPWGSEEIWAEADSYVGKILTIEPGHKLSRQYHNIKEETFRVLEGVLTLEINSPDSEDFHTMYLYDGDSFHCPPKFIHRMICESSRNAKAVKVLEVSTNHLDDIVRLEDDYKR